MTVSVKTFHVHQKLLEVRIAAPPDRVWRALVEEASSWWHRDFYTGGASARGFHFEPRLGGRMWEDWGDGQGAVWGTVIGVRRGEFLQLSGLLDAPFGGPANLLSTWRISAHEGGTMLRFEETMWGGAPDSTQKSLDSGWSFLIERCFKQWIETGVPVTEPFTG